MTYAIRLTHINHALVWTEYVSADSPLAAQEAGNMLARHYGEGHYAVSAMPVAKEADRQ